MIKTNYSKRITNSQFSAYLLVRRADLYVAQKLRETETKCNREKLGAKYGGRLCRFIVNFSDFFGKISKCRRLARLSLGLRAPEKVHFVLG